MIEKTKHRAKAYWSLAGLAEGARLTAPVMPGTIVFAAAFGTIAAHKGLTLLDATLMSAIVFAGASQLVAMEIWPDHVTLGAIGTLAVVTGIVNMRLVLMSASLRPWLGGLPSWQVYPMLYLTTDAGWLIGMRYRATGGSDASIYLGSGLALWAVWVSATVPGYLLGALIANPHRLGLDLVMPAFFTAMLVPLWRGARHAISWAVAGLVALVCAHLVPGWWFIIVGALAGSLVAGFLDEPR
jgi:predicted branched-subunit amino acid permease